MTRGEIARALADIAANGQKLKPATVETAAWALMKCAELSEADGCAGCAFAGTVEWEMPCRKCCRNSKDYWRSDG